MGRPNVGGELGDAPASPPSLRYRGGTGPALVTTDASAGP